MNNVTRMVVLCFSLVLLASCGSGGSDAPAAATDKTFSVSLKNADIRRVSNGDTVDLDTTGISSQQLTLKQQ